MKRLILNTIFIFILFFIQTFAQSLTDQIIELKKHNASDKLVSKVVEVAQNDKTFDIDEIIQLKKAGISEETIFLIIENKTQSNSLSPEIEKSIKNLKAQGVYINEQEIINMKNSGLSDETILTYLNSKRKTEKTSTRKDTKYIPKQVGNQNTGTSYKKKLKNDGFSIKGSIGYLPTWNVGLGWHKGMFGIEATFSTNDAASYDTQFNERYNTTDFKSSGYSIEIAFWGISKQLKELITAGIAIEYGITVTYQKVDIDYASQSLTSEGDTWGYGLFAGIHHSLSKNIFLEYRIGYRFFSDIEATAQFNNFQATTEFDGSQLNSIYGAVSFNILF